MRRMPLLTGLALLSWPSPVPEAGARTDGVLVVGNQSARLVLDSAEGHVRRIEGTAGRPQIDLSDRELWRVTLRDSQGRGVPTSPWELPEDSRFPAGTREVSVSNTDAGRAGIGSDRKGNDELTVIGWRNLGIGPQKGVLDVVVRIRSSREDRHGSYPGNTSAAPCRLERQEREFGRRGRGTPSSPSRGGAAVCAAARGGEHATRCRTPAPAG